jgi:YVTN family beta-propeller protein
MADVFLSYQHGDRAGVEPIVDLLARAGLTVWWDTSLVAGERFAEVISSQLKQARCVVVAWSEEAIKAEWVLDEASFGRKHQILVPFSLDGTPPPASFRGIQTPDLSRWSGDPDAPVVQQLLVGVQEAVRRGPVVRGNRKRRVPGIAVLATVVLAAVVLTTILVIRHASTTQYAVGSIALPRNATNVALDPQGRLGYVVHSGGTISVVDLPAGKVVGTITDVGGGALALALTPDGRVGYLSHYASRQLTVIDMLARRVAATIDVGGTQWDLKLTPDGHRAYLAHRGSGTLSVLDTAHNTLVSTLRTTDDPTDSPVGIAVTPNGELVYVANRGLGTVTVLETAGNTIVRTIAVQGGPNGVAVSPDGQLAYVTNEGSSTVSVINTGMNAVTATIGVGSAPVTVAFTNDGRALVVNRGSMTVSVIDVATGALQRTISVGGDLGAIVVARDGRTAYVTGGDANLLNTINL